MAMFRYPVNLGSVTNVTSTPQLLIEIPDGAPWVLTQVDCYGPLVAGESITAPIILIDLSSGTMDLLLLGVADAVRGEWEAHWSGAQVLGPGNLTATNINAVSIHGATVTCSGEVVAQAHP